MKLNNAVLPYHDILSGDDLIMLQSFAKKLSFPDTPSFVFHREEKKQKIDEKVRNSHTVHVKDRQLLLFIEERILKRCQQLNPELVIKFARDYVTFIKYTPGGFFDWHVDFEKVVVNGGASVKEMHLLFCLEGPSAGGSGGEFLVKTPNTSEIQQFTEAKTTNQALIFDKLLEHRAETLNMGEKVIMTVDVFVNSIYSDVGLSSQQDTEFIEFMKGERKWFTIGSKTQFTDLYLKVQQLYPDKLQELIPFLQFQVQVGDNYYEADLLPNGLVRLEKFSAYRGEGNPMITRMTQVSNVTRRLSKVSSETIAETCIIKFDKLSAVVDRDDLNIATLQRLSNNDSRQMILFPIPVNKKALIVDKFWTDMKEYDKTHRCWTDEDKCIHQADVISTCHDPQKLLDSVVEVSVMDYGGYDTLTFATNLIHPEKFEAQTTHTKLSVLRKAISLPTGLYFGNEPGNFKEKEEGFSYHCNEPSYEKIKVRYRYGWVRYEENMSEPSIPFQKIYETASRLQENK